MDEKIPIETIEFQPDAIEIKNQPLPLWAQLCIFMPVLIIIGAIIWASLGQVDVIVQADGKIVSDKQIITMKPLERSVIKSIDVRIGDVVRPNQILITFDPTINQAEEQRLRNEMQSLSAKFDRLKAEFGNVDYKVNHDDVFHQWQMAIFKQRNEFHREKMNYYDEAVKQIDASRKSREDSLAKQRERLEAVQQIEQMFIRMREKQATSLKELLEISITRMDMERTVDELENSLLELVHQRGSTIASKNSFIQEWRNNISEELVKTDRDLTSTRKSYDKIEQLIAYVHLRSPCEAVVHEIASSSSGSAVREAESMITLIPLDGKIEMEAEIRPQDIGKVEIGSEVRVKLNAYPFQKHGTLDGLVRNLSEDTLQKPQGQNQQGGSASYYRARISLTGDLREVKKNFRMIPGMEAQVEIKTGRRRIIEYIVYPLIKAFDETAREP
ncbi:MAG: HlyD family type I secretion periplasmic adaptor subunit [Victivallaceae bacterium]|nr:HlyD family type I secretion periplasmic adaptor subunit [Victivallaceae bacterium]MDD4181502.1 HlyD family type I secretion periplasmic adaptor subunit [Victivallaceae bacterium]